MRSSLRWLPLLTIPLVTAFPEGAIGYNDLFGRAVQCNGGDLCGYYKDLCCAPGACYTDVNNQAQCSTYFTPAATVAATAAATGYMTVATTTYVTNGQYTVTSTYSTYVAGATQTAQPAVCAASLNQQSCGNICCGSNQYCFNINSAGIGQCNPYTAGSSGSGYVSSYTSTMYATDSAGVPLRPTASTLIVVTVSTTATASSSTTVSGTTLPFQTPIQTGANVTITSSQSSNGGGLSGGAIAGIVIGVLAALAILGLICFYVCLKGIFDGCMALFGLGRRRKEVDIYERRTHHSSGGGATGRTWYGAPRPARDDRRRNSEGATLLGLGAGLAALWAILGLKRRNERRKEEKEQSEYSYYSDYYTSASSASTMPPRRDDRRYGSSRPSRR